MNIRTIDDLGDVRGKYILIRDDFNVQIVDGKIMDAFRIKQSLPTIQKMISKGARVVVMSHLGRPEGFDAALSLRPIAGALQSLLGRPVLFADDCLSKEFIPNMKDGDALLLENLRFHPGEEKNDPAFAKDLAAGFDFYINDAFAVSHRAHASVDAVAKILPSFAGALLSSEIKELSGVLQNPARPLVGFIGTAKIGSKIGVVRAMAKLCDKLILGSVIGLTFKVVSGETKSRPNLGDNVKDDINSLEIKSLVSDIMTNYRDKIVLPIDKGVAKEFSPNAFREDKMIDDLSPADVVMDEGQNSVAEYKRVIDGAKTIIWNGTVGMAEWQPVWSAGTFALAEYIAEKTMRGELKSIIGGGDTVAALEATNTKDKMSYVSTGGGAFLEFIEGRELPGIKILVHSPQSTVNSQQ
ncbi:MAG: phosphoglycerate kinase [Rickettsiales bacterium]|jgi:phosphoglycerate kinase|nr:phosphoglycerate kinase [Rickettsiales bacterium]